MTEKEMVKAAIGTVVRSNRKAITKEGRTYTINQLAIQANVSSKCIERLERGECMPASSTLKNVITALHMNHDAFWSEVDQLMVNGHLK